MELAGRLRQLRINRGMTQKELAQPLYTSAYVSTIEAGRRHPSRAALEHFAARLGLTAEELLTGVPHDLPARLQLDLKEARVQLSSGRYDDAEVAYASTLESARRFNLVRIDAGALAGLALCAERKGGLEQAIELYEEAEEILRGEAATARADAVAGQARCHHLLGDIRHAIHLMETLLREMEEQDLLDPDALVRIKAPLSFAYFESGLYRRAGETAAEALAIAPHVADPATLAMMHVNVARVYLHQGKADAATESLLRAESLYRELDLRLEMGRAHLAHGFVLGREGGHGAREELSDALAVFQAVRSTVDEARTLNEMARLHRLAGNFDAARTAVQRAVELLAGGEDIAELALANKERGFLEIPSDPASAGKFFRQAIELYERAEEPVEVAGVYRVLGDLLIEQGNERGGHEAYRLGIVAMENRL